MSLAFIPYYIKFLGIEAYGLIGLFALLLICFTFLDMGIAPTVNREMAKYTASANSIQYIRDLLHTLEIIIFSIAVSIVLILYFSSDWVSTYWVHPKSLELNVISKSIVLMSFVIGLRFIESLYRSSLLGLQRQVQLSASLAFFATLRSLGAVLVLAFISNSILAYFIWQIVVSIISVIAFSFLVRSAIPTSAAAPKFSKETLYALKNFASAMMLISFLALLLTQIDKIVLSKMISLEQFGYYTFAAAIAAGLFQLVSPITQAYYPMLTSMVSKGQTVELVKAYHNGAKIIVIGITPIALILIFFGEEIIYMWTKDRLLATNSYPILKLLAIGNLLNCLMQMPYMLQLANGSTKWALNVSIAATLVSVPATIGAALIFGSIGAAWIWILVNIVYIFISIHFIKEKVFIKEKWHWYISDLFLPLGLIGGIFFIFIATFPLGISGVVDLIGYVLVFLVIEVILIGTFFRSVTKSLLEKLIK